MNFFYIYITIDSIFYIFFWIILSSSFFVVIVVVRFCIILVRNGTFYKKHKASYLVTILYCVIDNMYIYLWKMQVRKGRFILFAHGVQLDNRVHPPCNGPMFECNRVVLKSFFWVWGFEMFITIQLVANPHILVQATSERFLPTWATFRVGSASESVGCNQCWYSPFIGGTHQYVWVGYKSREVADVSFWIC